MEDQTADNALRDGKDLFVLLLNFLHKSLAIEHLSEGDALHSAGAAVLALLPKRPEAVKELAHKKLNVFPFKDVPLCWRRTFEEACLWQILKNLEQLYEDVKGSSKIKGQEHETTLKALKNSSSFQTWVDASVRLCDQAIIFTGAPHRRAVIDTVLEWIEVEAWEQVSKDSDTQLPIPKPKPNESTTDQEPGHPSKRRRLDDTKMDAQAVPNTSPSAVDMISPILSKEHEVTRQHSPSLSQFKTHMHKNKVPIILTGTLSHWPATKRWKAPRYWLRQTLNGKRLVPVELGSSYTDEGWGQRIMSFDEFLREHLLRSTSQIDNVADKDNSKTHRLGYLAQHDLFSQIPALRNDISVPDYCYVDTPESVSSATSSQAPPSNDTTPSPQLNIWLGPANTVSPAHTDPHHNILAQVFGRKYIRLFAPSQTDKMYPMTRPTAEDTGTNGEETHSANALNDHGVDMGNTSRVNVGAFVHAPDNADGSSAIRETEMGNFPKHESAEYVEAILEAGECLYIPRGWWHYIRSLEPSCNVSFWWD